MGQLGDALVMYGLVGLCMCAVWVNGVMYDRCMGVSNDPFRYIFIRDDMGEWRDVRMRFLAADTPAEIAVKNMSQGNPRWQIPRPATLYSLNC